MIAGCGGDGEATSTTAPPSPPTTLTAATTTSVPATTTAATTTTTTTTTILPPNAGPAFALTRVVFGAEGGWIMITNWGDGPGDLEGYWLVQSPGYRDLPSIELRPGGQAVIGLSRVPPPELAGIAVTVDLGPAIGILHQESGEISLFSKQEFDNPDALVSYVEWGEPGHAGSPVAIAAGLWTEGAIEVPTEAFSISTGVFPVFGPDDWAADIGG